MTYELYEFMYELCELTRSTIRAWIARALTDVRARNCQALPALPMHAAPRPCGTARTTQAAGTNLHGATCGGPSSRKLPCAPLPQGGRYHQLRQRGPCDARDADAGAAPLD